MSKLDEAHTILKALGLPPAQQNETACYVLLALLGLKSRSAWRRAGSHLLRLHDIIKFIQIHYGKTYAEKTRETIRRRVLHQFEQARLADRNPDDPSRPIRA